MAEREAWRVGTDTGPIYSSMVQTPPTFSPSLISLMVSVDVKHYVYLLTYTGSRFKQRLIRPTPYGFRSPEFRYVNHTGQIVQLCRIELSLLTRQLHPHRQAVS